MMLTLIVLIFAILYALKGGSGAVVFRNWEHARNKNAFLKYVLGGKCLSTLLAFVFALSAVGDFAFSLLFALGWLVSIAPSMGEEHGAIGRWGKAWGDYIEYPENFGRAYGVKKGLQRGVWIGACMALVTGYVPYLYLSILFIPCVFIGQELYYRVTGRDSWIISEPIIGAVVYGIPTYLWLAQLPPFTY